MRSAYRQAATVAGVLALGAVAIVAITHLQARANESKQAQLTLASIETELNRLQSAPFQASPRTGGSPMTARALIDIGEGRIASALDRLERSSPPDELSSIHPLLEKNYAALEGIYAIGASGADYGRKADRLSAVAAEWAAKTDDVLAAASHDYDRRASHLQLQATLGSSSVILLLLAAFAFLYRRSVVARASAVRLAAENERMADASRHEALTDVLTGLPNRRALIADLDEAVARAGPDATELLGLFDLDGFKQYNDTFGHPAGDALLIRLGERLADAVGADSIAYRMGGDEFCVLACGSIDQDVLLRRTQAALSEYGHAFTVTCSYGVARIPAEASSAVEALGLADQRLYEQKAGRSSAGRQSADVLLTVVSERSAALGRHLNGVARLAKATAEALGAPAHEIKRVGLAAELHDIGKAAIPDTILNKPDQLDEEEWALIRQHTLIGERIVRAAPSLAYAADLVRSSHERVDGTGYPDGLSADEIPIGAAIIAVADAFHAMTSDRPYRQKLTVEQALTELQRCAGTQFRADIVECFCALALDDLAHTRVAA